MLGLSFVHWLVCLSALIGLGGAAAYIRDTLSGQTQPNRVSWSMWALAPLVGAAAAVDSGADLWATSRIFLAGFLPLLVVIASFVSRQGYWKLTRFDIACGCLSLLALIVWAAVDSPRTAILLAATGDGLACLPTLRKARRHPETETSIAYVAGFLSALLVMPSIPTWDIENAAYLVYLLVANALLLLAVYRRRWGFQTRKMRK